MEFFSGPYFPAFGLNTKRYFVSLRIQSECGKIRTRKNSVFRHFSHSVGSAIQEVSSDCLTSSNLNNEELFNVLFMKIRKIMKNLLFFNFVKINFEYLCISSFLTTEFNLVVLFIMFIRKYNYLLLTYLLESSCQRYFARIIYANFQGLKMNKQKVSSYIKQ